MSARTACATPGYCTLTATSRPSCRRRAVDLADRGGGDRLLLERARTSRPSGASSSDSITLRMSAKRTFGAASRSSPSLRWNSSRYSSGTRPTSRNESTWPSFIAAPFIVPSAVTICSAASMWRRSSAAWLARLVARQVRGLRAELARPLAGGEAGDAGGAGDARGRDAVLGHARMVSGNRRGVRRRRRLRGGRRASASGVGVAVGAGVGGGGVGVGVGVASGSSSCSDFSGVADGVASGVGVGSALCLDLPPPKNVVRPLRLPTASPASSSDAVNSDRDAGEGDEAGHERELPLAGGERLAAVQGRRGRRRTCGSASSSSADGGASGSNGSSSRSSTRWRVRRRRDRADGVDGAPQQLGRRASR